MSWPTPVGRSRFSASSSSVRFLIAAIASLSFDSMVTTTALALSAAFVVAPSTVLGHMPARCAIVSAGELDPVLDPADAAPAAAPAAAVSAPDPAAAPAPAAAPDATAPDPTAPDPSAAPEAVAPAAVAALLATCVMHFVISSEIAAIFF